MSDDRITEIEIIVHTRHGRLLNSTSVFADQMEDDECEISRSRFLGALEDAAAELAGDLQDEGLVLRNDA